MQFIFKASLICTSALLLLVADATAVPPLSTSNKRGSICYEQENGVFMPMPGSCSGFYICMDGGAIASSCGPFYRFNAAIGVCDHPALVQCPNFESNKADQVFGNSVDADDDDDFNWVMPTVEPVSPPSFPAHIPKPQSPEEVVYDVAAGDICEYQRNGVLLPKVDSCTHFYVCLMRRPYRRSCPPLLHFNAQRRLCQAPALAQCMTQSYDDALTLQLATFAAAAGNADGHWTCAGMPTGFLLPHDSSCERFWNCQEGEAIEMDCPKGLHFDLRYQRCEWPQFARCSL